MSNFQYMTLAGVKVDAIQFKEDDQDLTRAWPRWFIDMLIDGRIMKNRDNGRWYLDKETMIENNQWITRHVEPPHRIGLYSDPAFIKYFRPVAT